MEKIIFLSSGLGDATLRGILLVNNQLNAFTAAERECQRRFLGAVFTE